MQRDFYSGLVGWSANDTLLAPMCVCVLFEVRRHFYRVHVVNGNSDLPSFVSSDSLRRKTHKANSVDCHVFPL